MSGALHSWCMGLGALVALVPVGHGLTVRRRVPVGSGNVVSHCAMAACMTVLAVGAGRDWASVAALALAVAAALLAVELRGNDPGTVHGLIDLLAMAWIVIRGCSTPAVAAVTPATGHHHGASGHTSELLNWLPLAVWVGAIVLAGRHTIRCRGPRAGRLMTVTSLLMALSMAPMIA